MGAWKLVIYPFGLAIVGLVLSNLIAIALFGPDSREWFDWQNRLVGGFGATSGCAGFVGGVYLAIRAQARLLP